MTRGVLVSAALLVFWMGLPASAQDFRGGRPGEERFFVEFHRFGREAPRAVRDAGGRAVYEFGRYNVVAAWLSDQARERLLRNPNVRSIQEDPKRYPMTETTPYGITMIQADQVSDSAAGNRTICVIDSGYSWFHDDLSHDDANVSGTSDSGAGTWNDDTCGHGTHVSGTISALTNDSGVLGVLPHGSVKLHIAKVFDGSSCGWAYSSSLIHAVDVCRAHSANVVSMSLGGSTKSVFEESAFSDAYAAGILSVAAAGNNGSSRKSYPASYDSVISVAAIDQNKTVASFSQKNDQVELAAPGVGVLSTVPWVSEDSLTVAGAEYLGNHIENSAYASVAGTLVDGGLCTDPGSWAGAVVLCERGSVSFYTKVSNVMAGGGDAAAIYNNVSGGFLGTLGSGNTSAIPAISLNREDGLAAKAEVGQSSTLVSFSGPGSGYEAWNGTSMATPHVSAVAALVWSYNPAWTNADIRNALAVTALDLGAFGRDTSYGYGLVRAKAALDYLQPASSPTETPTNTPTLPTSTPTNTPPPPTPTNTSVPPTATQTPMPTVTPTATATPTQGVCLERGARCASHDDCCSHLCRGKGRVRHCR